MKNTGIVYDSTERMCTVLPEFAQLLPPLSEEQLSALESDILQNGCYAPVIVNENLEIVDGHNRFNLCEKHGVPYKIAVFHFDDRLEAKQWALDTQKARRNLTAWELGQIALKMKPDIEARARERQSEAGGDQKSEEAKSLLATLPKAIFDPVNTRKELSESAGIGEACVSDHASLHDRSVAKDRARIQACSMLRGRAVVEDNAAVCGGAVIDRARVSGCGGVCVAQTRTACRL